MSRPFDIPLPRVALWLALLGLCVYLLGLFSPILAPFVVAVVLAYVLHPLVLRLQAWRLPRALAVLLVELLAILLAVLLVLLLVPVLVKEWPLLMQQLPRLLDRLDAWLQPLLASLGLKVSLDVADLKRHLMDYLQAHREDWLAPLWRSVQMGGSAALALIGHLVLVPVVLFYMLYDWERVVDSAWRLVPPRWRSSASSFAQEADRVLGEYLRGQVLVMLVLAVFYALGLWWFGLDLALPIGVFTGLAVMVPYVGFGLGLVLALLAGLLQFDPLTALTMVAVVYGVGQVLESVVLTPWLIGERIGLHPLAVILALLAFGQLFGFVGVLVALPASAVLLVALRRLRERYLASDLYRDGGDADPGASA